jgi:hypothetical protein
LEIEHKVPGIGLIRIEIESGTGLVRKDLSPEETEIFKHALEEIISSFFGALMSILILGPIGRDVLVGLMSHFQSIGEAAVITHEIKATQKKARYN